MERMEVPDPDPSKHEMTTCVKLRIKGRAPSQVRTESGHVRACLAAESTTDKRWL